MVERRTCILFECHTDLIMSYLMDEEEDDNDEEETKHKECDDVDMLLNAMKRISNSK